MTVAIPSAISSALTNGMETFFNNTIKLIQIS